MTEVKNIYEEKPHEKVPMKKKPSVMTARELEMHQVLVEAFPLGLWIVLSQVAQSAFMEAEFKRRWEIEKSYVDFLLCNKHGVPMCVIELDDSTHERKRTKEVDGYKDARFAEAGLPIVRFKNIPSRIELLKEVLGRKVLKTITN